MKKLTKLTKLVLFLFLIPFIASAGSVQVFPRITNSHGSTKFAKDITVCIESGTWKECSEGVPTFVLPQGSTEYRVVFSPPPGYSYSSISGCSGIVQETETLVCNVEYEDGAPIVAPAVQTATSSEPQPVVIPPVLSIPIQVTEQPAPVLPISTTTPVVIPIQSTKSGLTVAQVDAIIGLLRAFEIDEQTISIVQSLLR